jgi:hypothetical protein
MCSTDSCAPATASPTAWPTTYTNGRDHPQPQNLVNYDANLVIDLVSFTAHALRAHRKGKR